MAAADLVLAVDIGGTEIVVGLVDALGRVVRAERVATHLADPWSVVAPVLDRVLASAPTAPIVCGVGCGGPMTPDGEAVSPLNVPGVAGLPAPRPAAGPHRASGPRRQRREGARSR